MQPCSIEQAFAVADAARPYVEMTPGTYASAGTVTAKNVTLVADQATLRVELTTAELRVIANGSLTIRHLKVLTGPDPFESIRCENSILEASDIDITGQGITASGCPTVKVAGSRFSGGKVASDSGGVIIDRSVFIGDGPSVVGSKFFAVITNCLIVAPSTSPGYALRLRNVVDGDASAESRIEYNTFIGGLIDCNNATSNGGRLRRFTGNIFANLTEPPPVTTTCVYNYNLIDPPFFAFGGGIGNVTGDPKFVDPVAGDYHLQSSSPAINAGDPAAVVDHDLDNTPRPRGGRVDIGAYEAVQ